jgi:DNA-binding NtrC family response regulator
MIDKLPAMVVHRSLKGPIVASAGVKSHGREALPASRFRVAQILPSDDVSLKTMNVKLLLADDDEEVLAALQGALTSEGYEVIVAKNGREAIEHFYQGHIDLALIDLNMPIKGGWETFERLTNIHPLLPVIVITAHPDQYPLAVAAGVGALMEKPLDLPLLFQAIEELLHEPVEKRLSRLTGKRPITRYLHAEL